ncbi:hypothetical protein [Amycolatopsis sp. NPDC058986]|uniref:hypothetical protein n=1 Tax=unclassified Amycolatopsis TaxID=2618356 RepID=UPI0036716504
MSFSRENVTWQAPDGTWCMGFFTVIEPPFEERGEDYDEEHDVGYDVDTFEFATTGHRTEAAAWKAAVDDRGIPNPGGSMVYRLPGQVEECAEFDAMAAAYLSDATSEAAALESVNAHVLP